MCRHRESEMYNIVMLSPYRDWVFCKSRYFVLFLTSRTTEAETELSCNTELTSVCQCDLVICTNHAHVENQASLFERSTIASWHTTPTAQLLGLWHMTLCHSLNEFSVFS